VRYTQIIKEKERVSVYILTIDEKKKRGYTLFISLKCKCKDGEQVAAARSNRELPEDERRMIGQMVNTSLPAAR